MQNKYLDFTLDPVSFSEASMTTFVSNLHNSGQNFVPIVDPGVLMQMQSILLLLCLFIKHLFDRYLR